MKKIAIAAFAALAFVGSAFADVKLSFENKVYEDDAVWAKFGKDETGISAYGVPADKTEKDFPAIKNSMKVELESDQVDAMVKGIWDLDDDDDSEHYYVEGSIDDWYIEFRPVEILTLALHDNIYSEGSYLPIYDDNLQGGNIGSDGFTVVVRPNAFNKALRIAATIPWGWRNYINGKEEDYEDENFHVGAGFIFSLPQIEIGATFQQPNCSDDRLIGASVAFPTLFGIHEGLKLSAGFTNSKAKDAGFDDLIYEDWGGVEGENIVNAAVTFEQDALSLAAEVVYAIDQDEPTYGPYGNYLVGECYAALTCGYSVTEQLTLGVTGKIITYKESDGVSISPMWSAGINADYDLDEHNSFGAGFEFISWSGFEFGSKKYDGVNGIKVPVYWKWSL